MKALRPGLFLVAEPAMPDPNFKRSVILICDHSDEGTVGLVVNKPTGLQLASVMDEPVSLDNQLFIGGPVQPDTLGFIHTYPNEVEMCLPLTDEMAFGGKFYEIAARIEEGSLDSGRFRFFSGYAGWSSGQLADEIAAGSWLMTRARRSDVFHYPSDRLWRDLLLMHGTQEMSLWANFPDDPQMN